MGLLKRLAFYLGLVLGVATMAAAGAVALTYLFTGKLFSVEVTEGKPEVTLMTPDQVVIMIREQVAAVFAIPCNLFAGFFVGLVAPVAAIAGMVALIRLVTGKVPFLGHIYEGEDGERQLSFKLVAPDEAEGLFTEYKERFGDELGGMKTEIQAIIEEAKGQARPAAEDEVVEVELEVEV
jgi:hypothetical protein